MRKSLAIAVVMLGCTLSAMAWNCNTPGQVRVQVPNGTLGSGTGDGPGQVVVDSGLTFICETLPTATNAPPSAVNTNTNNATSASNSTSTATGGNASSTATGGNSSSLSGVSNSGNSSNTNNNTLQGGNQSQKQSNSSTNNNASTATGNGDNANDSTSITNIKPASATAFAPVGFATAPCMVAFGAGAQSIPGGISFGGSRTDKGCDSRATAQQFALLLNNRVAVAKILCTTKAAKRAHLTMEDCLASVAPVPSPVMVVPPVSPPPVVAPAPSITVNVPPSTMEVFYVPIPHETITVVASKPTAKRKAVHKSCPVTPIQNQCAVQGEK
jgi:hypothetical protein